MGSGKWLFLKHFKRSDNLGAKIIIVFFKYTLSIL
jgi:hypothetical protein